MDRLAAPAHTTAAAVIPRMGARMGPPFRRLRRAATPWRRTGGATSAPEADPWSGLLDVPASLFLRGTRVKAGAAARSAGSAPVGPRAGCPAADSGIGSVVVRPSEGTRAAGGRSPVE